MVVEGRDNSGGGTDSGGRVLGWSGDAVNGPAIEVENEASGDGNSPWSSYKGFKTYKRRRHSKTRSLWTELLADGKVVADSINQFPEKQTVKEPRDKVLGNSCCEQVRGQRMDSHAVMSDVGDFSLNHWRNRVLEKLNQSLCESEGGLQGCIQDALLFHPESGCINAAKGSVNSCGDHDKWQSQKGWMANETQNTNKHHEFVVPGGSLNQSNLLKTNLCRCAFFDIVMSENFAQLCCLLMVNFQGIKVDSILEISPISSRMKDGAYERSPKHFHSDMQQLWTKLQKVGSEMTTLAMSLSDKSRISYREQVEGFVRSASDDGKDKLLTGDSDLHAKPEQMEACGFATGMYKVCICPRCGGKVDGRDCLVCDSCEEVYHITCIDPTFEEIPLKSWYCANCTASGIQLHHDNCVVCEKLNASVVSNNRVGDEVLTIEETFVGLEENSNSIAEHNLQPLKGGGNSYHCNVCRSKVVTDGENIKVCGHRFCPHKYYHVNCLTSKQVSMFGPCWYCPSCLCRGCLTDRDDEKIVLCNGCDHAYHIYCMQPPRTTIPRGDWFCRKCSVGIWRIRKINRKKRDGDGKGALEKARKERDEELTDKSAGVDMLLSAAENLNHEVKRAATHLES